jgi:hypothetical protein
LLPGHHRDDPHLIRATLMPMATKITVRWKTSWTQGPVAETLRFGLDGTGYKIDLKEKNARAFQEAR